MKGNVFLVGPMGAGKTTIGKQLANALGLTFKDSDHEIVERTGASIPWIFDVEGEEGFRRREREMIGELSAREGLVLATGGGAVLAKENRRHLKERGTVVYLQASIEQLLKRTARDKNRPLLQTEDPRAKLEALMAEREPLYRETADIIINTEQRSLKGVIKEISRQLEQE